MRAIVLVGGAGTRLRPLTLGIPKQVLPVAEVPMICRVLAHLEEHGVSEAILSLGYLSRAFTDLFPDGRFNGVRLDYAVEPVPLDTGGAIAFAARQAGVSDTFLVVNGDVLTDLDLTAMVEHHHDRAAQATLALTEVSDPSSFGLVRTAGDGCVQAFLEKPSRHESDRAQVNAGAYVFEPKVLDRIPDGRRVSVEREVFPGLAAEGGLYGFPFGGYWTDTGTPAQYLQAQLDLVAGRRPGPPAPGACQIAEGVWALGEPEVEAAADVKPPVLLGAGARVEAGATVATSVVGAGATVRAGARVEESVLLTGAVVEPGARVHRSVLGPGASVGEGASVSEITVVGAGVVVEGGSRLAGARLPEPEPVVAR